MDASTLPVLHEYGFSAFTYVWSNLESGRRRGGMRAHTHLDLEFDLIERGGMRLEFGGTIQDLCAREPVLFWAGIPHRIASFDEDTVVHVAQIPLSVALAWGMASRLDHLLHGGFLREPLDARRSDCDLTMFASWPQDLAGANVELRHAAELEVEGRVTRFIANALEDEASRRRPPLSATAEGVAEATRYIARHFTEKLTAEDVAAAVGWKRSHLMASFRRLCGTTVTGYVTRLRVREAERLLVTTDLAILEVCHRVGFSGPSRMYDAFARLSTGPPSAFRRARR